jgi:prepilin-type N-terminal cleavage/methylation domain-containing protein
MPTYTAPVRNNLRNSEIPRRDSAFTLTEMIVVVFVISLILLTAMMNLFGLMKRNTFEGQIQEFVSTLQMAVTAASESERRYEVIIDFTEQTYMLREITSPDLKEVLEEEIIVLNDFGENCQVAYVLFDDGEYTNDSRAKFRAGHSGWQYGGKIVLLDENEREYTVIVNRLSGIVSLEKGDVDILEPKRQDEIPF